MESILDEINPGGWKSFLFGDAAESILLDENGELVLVPPGATVCYEDGKLKVYRARWRTGSAAASSRAWPRSSAPAARARAPR